LICGDSDLFVGSQDPDAIRAAFSERLSVRVLGLVLALAIEDNRLGSLGLGEEEEVVDAVANLLRQLHELESLRGLEEDNLMAFILLTFRDNKLGNVSDSKWR
jgi:hypothetical protein